MKSKKCNKCGEVKTVDCFANNKTRKDGLQSNCKECDNKRQKKWRQENKNKIREYQKKYHQENRDKELDRKKKYRQENKNKLREYHKKYHQENRDKELDRKKKYYRENREKELDRKKKYYRENKERYRKYNKKHRQENTEYHKKWRQENREKLREYHKNRCNTDPLYKLRKNVRKSIHRYLKNGKSKRTSEILKCSFEQLLLNLGHPPEDAHLDHIVPQGLAINEEEVYALNHWSNFQWLPAQENMSKSSNFTYEENLNHVLKNHPEPAKIRAIIRRAQKDGYQIVKSDKRQSKESILAGLY